MSAGVICVLAVVTVGVALILRAISDEEERSGLALGALVLGAIAGVALTVSGFMMMDGWAARMEHFDFSGYEPTMNPGRRSNGGGPMFAIYFWPYEVAAFGVFATFWFGRQLWRSVRTPKN
jgi:hypothetical protein